MVVWGQATGRATGHGSGDLAVDFEHAYVVLALRFPARGVHDRLAGTYLVPR